MSEQKKELLLSGRNIKKFYGSLQVLKGVDIDLYKGEVVSLVGASGAGKSTLLQLLGTLDNLEEGTITYKGKQVTNMRENEKAAFRNKELGFVFQFHHLLPEFDALENVCLPAFIAQAPREATLTRAKELLEFLGLGARLNHRPAALSGGEQQRVAIARSLINRPELILADEPTGNLDSANSTHLYELFKQLAGEMGVGILITTHNDSLAQAADRQLKMKDGMII